MSRYVFRQEHFGTMCYDNVTRDLFLNKNISDFPSKEIRVINNSILGKNTLTFPAIVFLKVNQKCNLRCMHCLSGSSDEKDKTELDQLNLSQLKSIIDEIYDCGGFVVKVTGGEPFLRSDIFDILSYIDSKPLSTILFSNGILIDDDAIEKLKRFKYMKIRISLDGVKETNDSIRGKGTFDAAYSALRKLYLNGINCEVSYTVHSKNYLELKSLINILEKDNINCNIYLNLLKVAGNALSNSDLMIQEDKTKIVFDAVKNQIENKLNVAYYNPFADAYLKIFGKIYGCPAGKMSLSIDSNGDVLACGLFYDDSNALCGNVKEKTLNELWQSKAMRYIRELPEKESCTLCDIYKKNCTGGCRGNALNKFNDLYGKDINHRIYNLNFSSFANKEHTLFAYDCL